MSEPVSVFPGQSPAAGGAAGVRRPIDELAAEIVSGAVRLAAASAAWLSLLAEFDEREGWCVSGVTSCAHWLAWQCGLGPGAAREHVRVARALRSLPLIAEAFAGGRVSFSKVRAMCRVAEPATEASLLEFASHATASQLERVVRAWRRSDAVAAGEVAREQLFDWHWDDDGMLCLRVRMPAEEGAALLASVESLVERRIRRERAAGKRATAEQAAAERGTQRTADRGDGSKECAGDVEASPRERRAALRCAAMGRLAAAAVDADGRAGDPPRREVVVHVDAALLADDAAAGKAHIEGGPALAPAQVRRMLCEATVVGIVHDGGDVLAHGRRRRYATKAQRRALMARDGGCARPGCEETRVERLHAHHLRPWSHGGRTDVAGMVLLCDVDHGLVHHEELTMTRRHGRLIVTDRDGGRVWGRPDAAFAHDADGRSAESAFTGVGPIDRRTRRRPERDAVVLPMAGRRDTGATVAERLGGLAPAEVTDDVPVGGERMDLAHVVWVLLGHRDHLRRQAA